MTTCRSAVASPPFTALAAARGHRRPAGHRRVQLGRHPRFRRLRQGADAYREGHVRWLFDGSAAGGCAHVQPRSHDGRRVGLSVGVSGARNSGTLEFWHYQLVIRIEPIRTETIGDHAAVGGFSVFDRPIRFFSVVELFKARPTARKRSRKKVHSDQRVRPLHPACDVSPRAPR